MRCRAWQMMQPSRRPTPTAPPPTLLLRASRRRPHPSRRKRRPATTPRPTLTSTASSWLADSGSANRRTKPRRWCWRTGSRKPSARRRWLASSRRSAASTASSSRISTSSAQPIRAPASTTWRWRTPTARSRWTPTATRLGGYSTTKSTPSRRLPQWPTRRRWRACT